MIWRFARRVLKAARVVLIWYPKYLRIPSFTNGMILPEKSVHPGGMTPEPALAESIANAFTEHTGVTGSKTDVNLRVNELKEELSMAYSV